MMKWLPLWLVLSATGCPDVEVDPNEVAGGPTVEFDPAKSQATGARFIPFPNDLVRDPATGKLNLGPQACESPASKATREGILNTLDGFGTYETAMQVTFTQPVKPESLAGHVLMFEIAHDGQPITPSAATQPIPVVVVNVGKSPRFASGDCAMPDTVDSVTLAPAVPLDQRSTYFVVLTKGITNADDQPFTPAYTWAIVAAKDNPVTLDAEGNVVSDRTPLDPADPAQLEQLKGLAQLWTLHAPGLAFVEATGVSRFDVLVGFQFTTQTTTDPLNPMVAGSPASMLASVGVLNPMSITGKFGALSAICTGQGETNQTQCFLKLALGGCAPLTTGCGVNNYQAGNAACQLFDCAAVGDVIGGGILTANYQQQLPNAFDPNKPLQGPWTDPVHPEQQATLTLETLVVIPTGVSPMNNGWPVVVFGHGLGSSKESVLAIAGRLASAGFATVAIDTSAHGSRAVRISNDINLGCSGMCFGTGGPTGTQCDTSTQCNAGETCGSLTASPSLVPPSPTSAPQCYAPFLSADLATTRDGIRQTILDIQRVVKALKTCGSAGCGDIKINPDKIYYAGISLGSILGTMAAATSPDIKVAVLNVGGVGWADILENTETLSIRCSLVNGLIDAGILTGEKWTGGETGLCTTPDWKTQAGYQTFAAIGRWVLDPADGANFTRMLATKRVLLQEVVGDTVVPNIATDRLAALLGLAATPLMGDPFNNQPSAAITTMPRTSKFVKYVSDADNVYVHSSLLRPAPTTPPQAGINGTLRLQVDATTYLNLNNE